MMLFALCFLTSDGVRFNCRMFRQVPLRRLFGSCPNLWAYLLAVRAIDSRLSALRRHRNATTCQAAHGALGAHLTALFCTCPALAYFTVAARLPLVSFSDRKAPDGHRPHQDA